MFLKTKTALLGLQNTFSRLNYLFQIFTSTEDSAPPESGKIVEVTEIF